MKVLIAEDDQILRNILKRKLQDSNIQVTSTSNGQEALQALQQETYDLALIDILMPNMDGMTLIDHLHQEIPNPPPVIVITNLERKDIPKNVHKVLIKSDYSLRQIIQEVEAFKK